MKGMQCVGVEFLHTCKHHLCNSLVKKKKKGCIRLWSFGNLYCVQASHIKSSSNEEDDSRHRLFAHTNDDQYFYMNEKIILLNGTIYPIKHVTLNPIQRQDSL